MLVFSSGFANRLAAAVEAAQTKVASRLSLLARELAPSYSYVPSDSEVKRSISFLLILILPSFSSLVRKFST